MYHGWYTIRNVIRTRRIIRKGLQRELLIAFHVVDHQAEVIVVHVNGIHERFDHVPAEERIVPVSLCEPMKEEKDTVPVQQLRLGITEGFHRNPQIFRLVLQGFQAGGGGRVPDPGGDGVVDVIDLLQDLRVLRFHRGQRGVLQLLLLEGHNGIRGPFDLLIREHMIQDEIHDRGFQVVLGHGFFSAALAGLVGLAGIIIVADAGF